jgi:hypothetical protein
MIESVILSLIYGPVAITVGCWLFFAMLGRANEEVVVCILSQKTASPSAESPRPTIALSLESLHASRNTRAYNSDSSLRQSRRETFAARLS